MIGLQHEMTYRLRVRGPMTPTRGSPRGERQYWEMAEGTLTGDRINARIAMPGGGLVQPRRGWLRTSGRPRATRHRR